MEESKEIEEDVFFADLSERISLLLMDDDEDSVVHCPSVTLQAFSEAIHPTKQPSFLYEQIYRRESKGTGVFIPCSSHPRRKNRRGRFASSNTKFHRHSNSSRGLPHTPCNNNPTPSASSLNPKSC
ncbi:unnamed protein product [Ilex paraguariensis]|uniref:Uncharacterized protein n=1 Tax=Ilex paraguariensis TaxID=185542 RepID=A0ABC8QXG1_9AQUA